MPEEMPLTPFNRVELLVHPFFALENARVKGEAGGVINVTPADLLKDYEWLGIIHNWKRKIDRISKNPNAIMIIIGPQSLERETPQRHFFEGKLSKKKLAQFSKEYQNLLAYAKETLGRRAVFIRHSLWRQDRALLNLLLARKYIPYKTVRVYAYGEYLGTKDKAQCVEQNASTLEDILEFGQLHIWKNESKGVHVTTVAKTKTVEGKKALSIESQSKIPTLQMAEVRRRLEKKGKITPHFLKIRLKTGPSYDFVSVANSINFAWNKRQGGKR